MKKLLVILLILIIIPSVFSFSILDFLKNFNINSITGLGIDPICDCTSYASCPNGHICEDNSINGCILDQSFTGMCMEATSVYPSTINFGNIEIGNSANQILTIHNLGSSPLMNINIYKLPSSSAINIYPTTMILAPGAQSTTTITFTPTQEISYNGNIIIATTNPNSQFSVSYSGQGFIPPNQCELSGGACRDSCLSNEEDDPNLTPYCPSGGSGTGSVIQQYCCMPVPEQNQCEQAGGTCRDSCLQGEQPDLGLTQYCPPIGGGGTSSATNQYCCRESCDEIWDCTLWSSCINNQQTRTCNDINNCGTTSNKPLETQSCNLYSCGNTPNNQCSTNQPYYCEDGDLIENCEICGCPLNQGCINNECINLNPTINLAPVWSNLEDLTVSSNQFNLNNLINLNNYVTDQESESLTISFADSTLIFSSSIIDCYISNSILNCNSPKKTGSTTITVKAFDGEKSSTKSFQIEVLQSFGTSSVVGVASNTAPIADAGTDIIVYPNQQFILDASKSYDKEKNIPSISSAYSWYENQQKIGEGVLLKKSYPSKGTHKIILQVKDSSGAPSTDSITIHVINKKQCKSSQTVYFPIDTKCDSKWPSKEIEIININSPIYSCNLFEVCSEDIDYVIEDAIDCCDGTPLQDSEKANACNFANQYSNKNAEKCKSLYLVKSLGVSAVYMQDYFEGEMCCYAVESLCNNPLNLYTARPIPNSDALLDTKNMACPNTPSNNKVGSWISDTKIELNNVALSDVPTHVSINQLSTGTCVDYSAALTTLLRKSGYRKDDVYTVEADTHAYNLVRLPGDKKYTIVDVTGNNDGLKLGSVPSGYDYCKNIKNCYNDMGESICPRLKEINGCENVKESLTQKTTVITTKLSDIFGNIYDKILFEVK